MSFLVMKRVNLFCDANPDKSKHLTLTEMTMPELEEEYQIHQAGGARVDIELATGIKAFEMGFNAKGTDLDLMAQFGLADGKVNVFTARGKMVDEIDGTEVGAVGVIHGRLARVKPDTFKRTEVHGYEYGIKGVFTYRLQIGDRVPVDFDWATNRLIINGVDTNASENALLGIG
ncbi:phage major tail tube protein [Maritalea porphyrae]|uniref:phage major tail tube protein n=1 Tax=Maritalea porphyrae TaxID=880732 RepID=UPI0022B01AEF|nr:phage major tail tube protein [Maritalea porphyrae]MCZ4272466.1 phage major tail tube protein [Maritalea porphyrae]